jgi:two-component system cell cycle sensor histidine kinase PleC
MARAGVASASAHPDSIKGLAQSVAKPAYRRLLNAEPLLRRAVPVLIIAFLATICVGALVQVLDHRRQTLTNDALSLEAVADLAAERLQNQLSSLPMQLDSRSWCSRACCRPGRWALAGTSC